MRIRNVIIVLTLLALFAAVSGCTGTGTPTPAPATATPGASGNFPVNITDSYGRTVTIKEMPHRIVSLSPSNTETLFALGLGDRIVGDTNYCNYPPQAANITHVSDLVDVSEEKVMTASPDVIFAQSLTPEAVVNKLQGMGYNTIANDPSNYTQIRDVIMMMGRATGSTDNATKLWGNISARVDAVTSVTSKLNDSQKPRVLLLTGYVPGEPIYVFGSNTYGDDLIKLSGGTDAAGNVSSFGVMSTEAIIKDDPDIIIVPVDNIMTTTADYNALKNGNESWMKGLSAVKNGKVYAVNGDIVNRPGPRVADAVENIARIVHPELFK